ncbi:MAG: hypothetical protein ACK51K_01060 [Gammaproteobacteria bacterium]
MSGVIDGILLLAILAVGYGVGRAVVQRIGEGAHERVSGIAAWLHRKVGSDALPAVMALIFCAIASLAFIYPDNSRVVLVSLLIVGLASLGSIRSREP